MISWINAMYAAPSGVKSSKGKRVGNNNNSTPSTWQIRYRESPHDQKDKELL
ncbi:MAG: hypothetical protein M3232_02690 [Thermoproteota archaeon]|nr:hypothetical protein [Thermoproteota archaeon]